MQVGASWSVLSGIPSLSLMHQNVLIWGNLKTPTTEQQQRSLKTIHIFFLICFVFTFFGLALSSWNRLIERDGSSE
jgi:ABC-type amino acid transport system permease subunit